MKMENNSVGWILIAIFATILTFPSLVLANEANGVGANVIVVAQTAESFQPKLESKKNDVSNCTAYFAGTVNANNCRVGEVPKQAATWLFILALIAFVVLSNKSKV